MTAAVSTRAAQWHLAAPIVAAVLLVIAWPRTVSLPVQGVLGVVLALAVISAVHHAEVVALRVGEPFGSLVLAVAVTVIEVALIVTLMSSASASSTTLARDTVFAALMITVNGIVGISIIVTTWRGGTAIFNAEGAGSGLAAIGVLATLSLVLPSFTTSTRGPTLTDFQLAFAAIAALTIYLMFVVMQTVRHRDYFLPPVAEGAVLNEDAHASVPSSRETWTSLTLLIVALVAVVGLAKVTTPLIETGVTEAGLPLTAVAVTIALLVLAPESIAAVRAARVGRIQTSINLAYGSAMASIGLTIPTIAVASWLFGFNFVLGLGPTEIVLLVVTMITGILTVTPGRATLLQGVVHLSLFTGFLVLVISP